MTHIPGHAAPQPYLPPADISPAPYGFGGGAQTFNPFGAYANTLGPTPMKPLFGHGTGSVWGDIKQTPGIGFIPGLGTAANWNEMGPWGRSASIGLDALDLATLGIGKGGTTPLRMGLTQGTKFLRRNDPEMRYLRFGQIPLSSELDPVTGKRVPIPSTSNIAYKSVYDEAKAMGRDEPGVSVYQSLFDPKTGKYVMRDAPSKHIMAASNPMNPHYPTYPYTHSPINAQNQFIKNMALDWQSKGGSELTGWSPENLGYYHPFEVTGKPMNVLGSDLEALLNPASIKRSAKIDPLDIVTQGNPSMALPSHALETMGAHPNLPRTVLSDVPNVSFENYDAFGNRIPNPFERLVTQASMQPTLPFTVPTRAMLNQPIQPPVRNRGNGDTGG